MAEIIEVPPGLAGVAVTTTEISDVLGDEGFYHYRGRPAPDLARASTFESVAGLVLFHSEDEPLPGLRPLPDSLARLVPQLDLRSGLSALGATLGCRPLSELDGEEQRSDAAALIATFPTLVASIHRGQAMQPDPDHGHVESYLTMLTGEVPSAEALRALETYFILTVDHGFSNSAFATRVVASAGADLVACLLAGFASLSGPRHGANQERMLDMFDAIETPDRAEDWLRNEMASRRRIQGFGHSVYRTADPRLELLREQGAIVNPERHAVAMATEEAGVRLLAGRRLGPNVDMHAAVVLEGCGIPRSLHLATFAAARIVGWCAHAIEQANEPKIIRPAAHYVGDHPQ